MLLTRSVNSARLPTSLARCQNIHRIQTRRNRTNFCGPVDIGCAVRHGQTTAGDLVAHADAIVTPHAATRHATDCRPPLLTPDHHEQQWRAPWRTGPRHCAAAARPDRESARADQPRTRHPRDTAGAHTAAGHSPPSRTTSPTHRPSTPRQPQRWQNGADTITPNPSAVAA